MRLQELFEAIPSAQQRAHTYYHGTSSDDAARSIWASGLDPLKTSVKYGTKKSQMRPEEGSVYITPDLGYAMMYALGGNFFGHAAPAQIGSEFGYVFEISGSDLVDIGPDEDSIGELAWKAAEKLVKPEDREWRAAELALTLASKYSTDAQYKKLIDGDYATWAVVGKKVNARLTDEQKLLFIDAGVHISHKGKLKVSKCWKFSKADSESIKADGSNFFDYARECDF